jgi:hypothetical protein
MSPSALARDGMMNPRHRIDSIIEPVAPNRGDEHPSPAQYVIRTMLWFASLFRPCLCGAVLDVRIEGRRIECGRCGSRVVGPEEGSLGACLARLPSASEPLSADPSGGHGNKLFGPCSSSFLNRSGRMTVGTASIKSRAVTRLGDLLEDIEKATAGRPKSGEMPHPIPARAQAREDAGISRDQAKQAQAVARFAKQEPQRIRGRA